MSVPARFLFASLASVLLVLLAGCKPQAMQASYHCADATRFHFSRQSQTVELIRGEQRFQGYMDERGLLTWPRDKAGLALPDSFFITRKLPDEMKLYGGFAGTGLACKLDKGR